MSNFRLNAKKPKPNAGLATPKGEIYLLYREDIVSMPEKDKKGVLTVGNIMIKEGRRFHLLYITPSTQVHGRETEGEVDSRGWRKKISGHYPGDELEINEFVKNNVNQGFVAVVKPCNSAYMKIYGSVNNPLYFTGSFVDDSEKKGYELTFEQTFADEDPVLFYQGKILLDEDATQEIEIEHQALFVQLDGSNITDEYKKKLREKLDIGHIGDSYTKKEVDDLLEGKSQYPILAPEPDPLTLYPYEFKYLYVYGEETLTGLGESPKEYALKVPIQNITKNISSHYLTSVAGAGLQLGANWEIDTAGYYLKFKNLEDKTSSWSIHKRALVIDDNGIVGTKLLYPRINEDFGTTQFNSPNGNCYISDVLLKTNEYGSGLIKFKLHMHNFSFQGEVIQAFTRDNFKYYDILFPDGENEWNPIKSFDFPFYINNLLIIVTAILYKNGKFYVNNWNHHRVTTLVGGYYTVTDNLSII